MTISIRKLFAKKPVATDWAVVPASTREIDAVVRHCRRLVGKRALVAAGAAVVPLPGIDWVTDVAVLVRVIPEINTAFGLTPEQIERLAPDRRIVVYPGISAGGSVLIRRIVTGDLVMHALRVVGVRLTTQQAAKFVPVAGQVVSAALTYSALRYVCEQHIQQCVAISKMLMLPASQAADVAS